MNLSLDHTSGSVMKVLNASGTGRVDIPNDGQPGSMCCEVFNSTEPWKDELVLFRDNEQAYVGPINSMTIGPGGGTLQSADLFSWFDVRWLEEDFHGDGDAADIFHAIFDLAYAADDSINMSISTRQTGIDAVRDFRGVEFQRAADVMRELARSALDFTMVGRRLLAGGVEVFETPTPLILHDKGCLAAEVTMEGTTFATDVAVFGSSVETGNIPFTGRATRSAEVYGLVQRSFTELTIKDTGSADANALARLLSMQPAPVRVKATLSPEAAFGFSDLIPGRRVMMNLKQAAGCVEVMGEMRLQQVDVSFSESDQGVSEQVTINCIPLGVSDA